MRIFWALMLVLAIGAAGVLASRYAKEPSSTAVVEQTSSRGPQVKPVEPRPTPVAPAPTIETQPAMTPTEPEIVSDLVPTEPTIDVAVAPTEATTTETMSPEAVPTEAAMTKAPPVQTPTAEETQTLDSLLGLSEPEVEVANVGETTKEALAVTAAPAAVAGEELAEGIILNQEKNLVVAGRFTVPGEGTAEKPYVVSWDLLLAVQEHYRPRQGMTEIPAWIKFFEGKHVRLAGFVMPPMMGDDMREILLMQNEWDGCCVGVPPTPYDAVEVKLTKNPRGLSQYTMNYGEITGVFKVDPFVQGEWLLGLYLMDGADLVIKGL